jgi:hypothetical protein
MRSQLSPYAIVVDSYNIVLLQLPENEPRTVPIARSKDGPMTPTPRKLSSFLLALFCFSTVHADCACGPTYCLDTPEFVAALAKKKKELSRDYPARLVAILDKASHCEACITGGPDGFTLVFKNTDGSLQTQSWDADNERIGAQNIVAGKLKACRVVWLREAFACCQQKKARDRPDWDVSLELSRDMSVPCSAAT